MSVQVPIITLNKLKKRFPVKGGGAVRAVEDISLTVYKGERLGVVGESGCGKSTLGRVILQLYRQTSGACVYHGRSLSEVAPRYRAREINKLLTYQHKARKDYQKSLHLELKARAARMGMDEVSAQASAREVRKYRHFSRQSELLSFQAKELRKEASRQLREGSRTVGSLILSRDLKKVQDLYREANQSLKLAHKAQKELLQQGKLVSLYNDEMPDTASNGPVENALRAHLKNAGESLSRAEAYRHTNIAEITERCSDPNYWKRLDSNQETGINLGKLSSREMRDIRRDMQMIFQDPAASLDPRETIGKAIGETFRIHTKLKQKERKERAIELLKVVGLKPDHYDYYPHQLSGGQKQRVGIARAIALHPRFMVLDESLSALDVSVQAQILQLLTDLLKEYDLTYFFITHNLGVVKHFCDRVMVMYLGSVCELAPVGNLFKTPLHPYTQSLLASVPVPEVKDRDTEEAPLMGEVPSAVNPPSGCPFHTRCPRMMPVCAEQKPQLAEQGPGHLVACHLFPAQM